MPRSSLRARSSSASVTSSTSTTWPTAIGRIQRWRPAARFLSRPSAAITATAVEAATERRNQDRLRTASMRSCEAPGRRRGRRRWRPRRAGPGQPPRRGRACSRSRPRARGRCVWPRFSRRRSPLLSRVAVDDGELDADGALGDRVGGGRVVAVQRGRAALLDQLPQTRDRRSGRPSGTRPCRRAADRLAASRAGRRP